MTDRKTITPPRERLGQFYKGERVRVSPRGAAVMPNRNGRFGTVAASNRDPNGCVSVLWDGNRFPYSCHSTFVERVTVSKSLLRYHAHTPEQRALHNLKARLRRYRTYDNWLLRRLAREEGSVESRIVLIERSQEVSA